MLTLISFSLSLSQLALPNLTFYQLHFHSNGSLFCCFTCYLNIFIIARILPELRVFSHKVPAATAPPPPPPLFSTFHLALSLSLSLEPWSVASRRSMVQRQQQRVQCWQKTESCGKINIAQNFSPHTHRHSYSSYTHMPAHHYPRSAFCFGLALMMYALWKELSKVVFRVWWANVDPGNMSSHLSLISLSLPLCPSSFRFTLCVCISLAA